jgi:hypothetical protein
VGVVVGAVAVGAAAALFDVRLINPRQVDALDKLRNFEGRIAAMSRPELAERLADP